MKKKIFAGITVLAIAGMVAFNLNMNINNGEVSSLSLANVEALASENLQEYVNGLSCSDYCASPSDWTCRITATSGSNSAYKDCPKMKKP